MEKKDKGQDGAGTAEKIEMSEGMLGNFGAIELDNPDSLFEDAEDIIENEEDVVETDDDNTDDADTDDNKDTDNTEVTGLDEYEEDVVNYLNDKLSEKLSLSLEDDKKPKSIDDVITLLEDLVEENSKPTFANERVEKINEFVMSGGRIEDYYKTVVSDRIPLDNIDLDEERVQKAILKEDLKNKGLTEQQIDKKLKRWEDAGVLYDEAEESLEAIKKYRQETEEKLLVEQKKQKQAYEIAQQNFFSNVDKVVKETNSIQGVAITEKVKKELLEYIFRPESDGSSKFYKETGLVVTHNTNPKLLLESAYYAKHGSALVGKLEKKAESQAAKILKDKLATKGSRGVNQWGNNKGSGNSLSSLGSYLLPNK